LTAHNKGLLSELNYVTGKITTSKLCSTVYLTYPVGIRDAVGEDLHTVCTEGEKKKKI
jgi:hypothetical protein